MRSEVVFVQAAVSDVNAAISLLTPGRRTAVQVAHNRIWTAVTVASPLGRSLAMALRQASDRTTFLLTVGPGTGTLTMFGRDGQDVGPVDGREQRAVTDLLRRWPFMRAESVASALTSSGEPADRIRQVAAAMRLPDPVAPAAIEPQAGTQPTFLAAGDPEQVRAAVRHLRRLRRGQVGLGVAAVAAGAGTLIAWEQVAQHQSSLAATGVLAALLILFLVLGAVVGSRRRQVRATAESQAGPPRLPH